MPKLNSLSLAVASLLVLSAPLAGAMGGKPKDNDDAIAARIQPVARVELAASTAKAAAGDRSGNAIYKTYCAACHDSGAAGAPKTGDKAAWAPRLGAGLDVLVKTVKAGKNAMPPNGGSNATEEELVRSIVFMANQSGGNF